MTTDWWTWYREYLRSPEWKRKRAKVLRGVNGRCEKCHRKRALLQVHHLSYARVGQQKNGKRKAKEIMPLRVGPIVVRRGDLMAVCTQRHNKIHGRT